MRFRVAHKELDRQKAVVVGVHRPGEVRINQPTLGNAHFVENLLGHRRRSVKFNFTRC
jgi:hypothetical protein